MTFLTDSQFSAKDLVDIILKLADQINFYWNFYVIANIAMLGWLLSLNANPDWQLKAAVSIAFIIFIALNITALIRSYIFLQAALLEFKAMDLSFRTINLPNQISRLSFSGYKYRLWVTHTVVDVFMIAILWSDKLQNALRIVDK
jgi:hypothetical protein